MARPAGPESSGLFLHRRLALPSGTHWLGTDENGRDLLSQLVLGAQDTMLVGFTAALVSSVLGTAVGVASGYFGGWTDRLLNALNDWFLVLPTIPMTVLAASLLGNRAAELPLGRTSVLILVIGLFGWAGTSSIVRAAVMSLLGRAFMERSVVLGAGRWQVIRTQIPPNVMPLVLAGEALGLAGESGCGKTTTALALLALLSDGLTRASGEILRDTEHGPPPLRTLSGRGMRAVRCAPHLHGVPGRRERPGSGDARRRPDPRGHPAAPPRDGPHHGRHPGRRALRASGPGLAAGRSYPHEFSGGQRLRIALVLACDPDLIIGDEPATALDVITQRQILDLLAELRRELGLSVLLITHDLSVLAESCDRIAVIYAGRIVETGSVNEVYGDPRHPCAQRLLAAFPAVGDPHELPPPTPGPRSTRPPSDPAAPSPPSATASTTSAEPRRRRHARGKTPPESSAATCRPGPLPRHRRRR